jgi:hypothetical protein
VAYWRERCHDRAAHAETVPTLSAAHAGRSAV